MPVTSEAHGITFLRHTENSLDSLTEAGVAAALDVGRQLSGDTFALVVTSGAQRTAQTAACVLASGNFRVAQGVHVVAGFGSADWQAWGDLIDRAGGAEVQALAAADPAMVEAAGAAIDEGLAWIRARLAGGQHALVVSHSPLIELAIWRMTGEPPSSFGRGQWQKLS